MTLFPNALAILVAIVLLTPLFFIKKKSGRIIIVVIAVIGFLGIRHLSDTIIYPNYKAKQFEKEINQQPLYQLIEKTHPKEYAAYVNKVKQAYASHQADQSTLSTYSAQFVNDIFFEHLTHAPDAAVNNYLNATLDLYRYLMTKDPRVIIKFENENSQEKVDLDTLWKDHNFQLMLQRLLDAKQEVIKMAIQQPVATPSKDQAEPLLGKVIGSLNEKYGQENVKRLLSKAQKTAADNDQLASFIIDFYSAIKDEGADKSGIIMRYIASFKVNQD